MCEAEYTLYRPDLALTLARCAEQLALVSVEPFLQNCGLLFDRSILARGVAPTGRLASRPCLRTLLQLSGKPLSSPIFRCGLGLDGPLQLACVLDQLLVALEGVLGRWREGTRRRGESGVMQYLPAWRASCAQSLAWVRRTTTP